MFCPACGANQGERRVQCSECGWALPRVPSSSGSDEFGLLVPIGIHPKSMTAGYVGIFGFFLCGLPGPVALWLGWSAIQDHSKNPELRGIGRAWTGLILGGLQTAVLAFFIYMAVSSSP